MTERNAKLAVAMMVLGAGVAAALMFRKESLSVPDGTTATADTLNYRSTVAPTTGSTGRGAAGTDPTAAATGSAQPSGPATLPAVAPAGRPTSQYDQLPTLPPHYDAAVAQPAPPRTAPGNTPDHMVLPQRTHTIVDGDTLSTLAERYLGSGQRAGEIYSLNRDRLPGGADLLPIGVVLQIPPADQTTVAPPPDRDAAADLVPIPPGLFRRLREPSPRAGNDG